MFGTPGAGGQMVYGDLQHQLGFAFLTNRMFVGMSARSPQFKALEKIMYDIVSRT